jgi:hypothetical protein
VDGGVFVEFGCFFWVCRFRVLRRGSMSWKGVAMVVGSSLEGFGVSLEPVLRCIKVGLGFVGWEELGRCGVW